MRMFKYFNNSTMSGARLAVLTALSVGALAMGACADDDPEPTHECTENKDCPGEQECNAENVCVDPDVTPECTKHSECPGDQVCNENNECEAPSATCGDGTVDDGEECDDGEANSDTEPNACRTNCTLPSCGDGIIDDAEEYGEECDDGSEGSIECSDTCEIIETTDVRWTSLQIFEPDAYIGALDQGACGSQLGLLNIVVDGLIKDPEWTAGNEEETELPYALSVGQTFPTELPEGEAADGTLYLAECALNKDEDKVCEAPAEVSYWTYTRVEAGNDCFNYVPEVPNEAGWSNIRERDAEVDTSVVFPSNDAGQCIKGEGDEAFNLELKVGDDINIPIRLNGTHGAFEWDDETSEIDKGVLAGFLTADYAEQQIVLEEQVDGSGDVTSPALYLSEVFNGGAGSCADTLDLSKGPNAQGEIVDGWWFYLSYDGDGLVSFE